MPGPGGNLPQIRDDGLAVAKAWSRPPAYAPGPKIGLVVGGLGLSQTQTQHAIDTLPPAVTLAFSPYAQDAQPLVDAARAKGFEVMVEAPGEPFDYPASDPGPQTLLLDVPQRENARRLDWVMSRFTGYFGVLMCEGARFLTRGDAGPAVAATIGERGAALLVCGDGGHRKFVQFAGTETAPYGMAALNMGRAESRKKLDQQLLRLEILALEDQSVIGAVRVTKLATDTITKWTETLPASGYTLVPASQIIADQFAQRAQAASSAQLTANRRETQFQTVTAGFDPKAPAAAGGIDDGHAEDGHGKGKDDGH